MCLASGHETEHAQKAHLHKGPDEIAAASVCYIRKSDSAGSGGTGPSSKVPGD